MLTELVDGTVDGRYTKRAFLRNGFAAREAGVCIYIRVPTETAVHRDGFGRQREREDLVCDHEEICACLCHRITSFQCRGKFVPSPYIPHFFQIFRKKLRK